MTPEYLEVLADMADPEELWRLPAIEMLELSTDQRKKLDAGVALRRYASHVRELRELLKTKKSLLITPLSESGNAIKFVATPPDHKRLRGDE